MDSPANMATASFPADPQIPANRNESWALAGLLAGRYGSLALSRAAGQAAAAEREGDLEQKALWRSVINDLRHAMTMISNGA